MDSQLDNYWKENGGKEEEKKDEKEEKKEGEEKKDETKDCLLYTSPSPRDQRGSRMPSSA